MTESRILIVDDQAANLRFFTSVLEVAGYQHLRCLEDSRHVVAEFTGFGPDLVLLDLHMPHVDGFAVMKQLAGLIAADDFLPFLVLTGDDTPATRESALTQGANDFLAKPFSPTEIVLRVKNLLHTRSLHTLLRAEKSSLEQKVRERTEQLEQAQSEILSRLVIAAEYQDDDLREHPFRVGELAARLAEAMGVPPDQVELVRRAAPLHDVGKIGLPDWVKYKQGALTPEEVNILRSHTSIGAEILGGSQFPVLKLAREIALCHHERWDGCGYPLKLSKDEIPMPARVVSVADTFDAMTNDSLYRRAVPVNEALAEIKRQRGRQFDPAVVDKFLAMQRK
jgi:putative two-component system response regulator